MDYYLGKDVVAKDLRPIYTVWKHTEVNKDIAAAKRRSRRAYKQYLKTGKKSHDGISTNEKRLG